MAHEPNISRSVTMDFVGDWGQANFHRILSWLTQEFCSRAGPRSRIRICNVRGGGIEALWELSDGEADLCIVTPEKLMPGALSGTGMFAGRPLPELRSLAVMPQNDCMVLAIDPKFGIGSFEDLRREKPALRIATSEDANGNFIGYVAHRFMEAHGIGASELNAWGGEYLTTVRPDQSLALVRDGKADAVVQEAIMTPWWHELVEARRVIPLSAEDAALDRLSASLGLPRYTLPAGYWQAVAEPVTSLDFSHFLVMARADMADDVAYLLTWCLTETRAKIEAQYKHIPPHRSPLSYPISPQSMARPAVELHPGAMKYYRDAGWL